MKIHYTENDLRLYTKLLDSSKDMLCFQLPCDVTLRDLDRLKQIGLCDQMPSGVIILCYNSLELQELKTVLALHQTNQEIQQQAQVKHKKEKLQGIFIEALGKLPSMLWKVLKTFLPF